MKILTAIVALLATLCAGCVLLFTLGEIAAVVGVLVVIAVAVAGFRLGGANLRLSLGALAVVLVASLAFGGYTGYQLAVALTDTSGPADPADPADLASAEAKLDSIEDRAGFRVELTEAEMTAYFQDALSTEEDSPIRAVVLDVQPDSDQGRGSLEFEVKFKGGGLHGEGAVAPRLESGRVAIDILSVDVGNLSLPGIADGAVEDIIETVLDLNEELAAAGADVQAIELTEDSMIVTGAIRGGEIITSEDLLGALAENAASVAGAASAPEEVLGPGVVDSAEHDGPSYYVALGDSLAANVGVDNPAAGYVSRFHNQLQIADGAQYGLRNFGVSGETSSTLIRDGQLDSALEFIEQNPVDYVTLDIGANDLLGHIGSADCADDFAAAACQARLSSVLAAYGENLAQVFQRLRNAAPQATIIFLQTYNPFSLGFGGSVNLEAGSDEIVSRLNAVAASLAPAENILIADGFTPMQGTTAATTHMLDSQPDIHPNASGYDLLAQALVDGLP